MILHQDEFISDELTVLLLDFLFGLLEGVANRLVTVEHFIVEVLRKLDGSLIQNGLLLVDADHVRHLGLLKYGTDALRVTTCDEDKLQVAN